MYPPNGYGVSLNGTLRLNMKEIMQGRGRLHMRILLAKRVSPGKGRLRRRESKLKALLFGPFVAFCNHALDGFFCND